MNAKQLAKAVGVDYVTAWRWLSGLTRPRSAAARRIAELGVSLPAADVREAELTRARHQILRAAARLESLAFKGDAVGELRRIAEQVTTR